jgi:hypothetical protein
MWWVQCEPAERQPALRLAANVNQLDEFAGKLELLLAQRHRTTLGVLCKGQRVDVAPEDALVLDIGPPAPQHGQGSDRRVSPDALGQPVSQGPQRLSCPAAGPSRSSTRC